EVSAFRLRASLNPERPSIWQQLRPRLLHRLLLSTYHHRSESLPASPARLRVFAPARESFRTESRKPSQDRRHYGPDPIADATVPARPSRSAYARLLPSPTATSPSYPKTLRANRRCVARSL